MYTLCYWLGWLVWLIPDLGFGFIKLVFSLIVDIPEHPENVMGLMLLGVVVALGLAMFNEVRVSREAKEEHFIELAKHNSYCTATKTMSERLAGWRKEDRNRVVLIKDINRLIQECEDMVASKEVQSVQDKFLQGVSK